MTESEKFFDVTCLRTGKPATVAVVLPEHRWHIVMISLHFDGCAAWNSSAECKKCRIETGKLLWKTDRDWVLEHLRNRFT